MRVRAASVFSVFSVPSVVFLITGIALAQNEARPSVVMSLADPAPVIGVTGETELRIEVIDPPETPMPAPRVLSSTGQVEDLTREGPIKFTARYILPSSRFPQNAILVAEFAQPLLPLRGVTVVRLRAAATPALRTDPGAQVTIRVDDHEFGPQVAPADGMVRIPVVVPPGVEFAVARSINQYGKATEQVVDLQVPYSQRVLVAAPRTIAAGAVAEVAVYAVEPSGRAADASTLVLWAPGIRINPLGSRLPGEARFLVTAPTVLRDKSIRLEAMLAGQSTTRVATRIDLVPAPAAGLSLVPEAPQFGRAPSLRVFLGAQDAFGNSVDAGRAGVLVDGIPAEVEASLEGEPLVVLRAPSPTAQRAEVVVEGVLDSAHATLRVPLRYRASASRVGLSAASLTPRLTLTPRLGVFSNLSDHTGATLFVEAAIHRSARDPGLGLGLALGLVQTWFAAESQGGISRAALTTLPLLFQIRQRYLVADRVFLGFGAGGGFAVAFARVQTFGDSTFGASYGGAAETNLETGFLLGRAHLVLSLRYLLLYFATFSSGDVITGNAGGAIADLGYRLVW